MELTEAASLHEAFFERLNAQGTDASPTLRTVLEKLEIILIHELDEIIANQKGSK